MSLYGINAYNSNSMYNMYSSLTSLMSGSSLVTGYNSNKNNNSLYGNSSTDLNELMKKAAMVRSPSYQKKMLEQLKSVFSGEGNSDVGTVASEQKVSETAKKLNSAAASLSSVDFSNWTNKTDAVKSFVEKYNSEIDSLADATETADLGRQSTLINTTKKYASTLEKIGVTIGEDNKLTIDDSKLNTASDKDVKALLSGNYSYGGKIGYDMTTISDATSSMIKSFADYYNSTLDSLEKSDSVQALEKGVSMVNTTRAYARTLNNIGLTVGSDNRITVNADKLSKASDSDLKALFSGSYSYATKIADKAGVISRAAGLSAQLSYNSQGKVNSSGNVFTDMFNMMYNTLV